MPSSPKLHESIDTSYEWVRAFLIILAFLGTFLFTRVTLDIFTTALYYTSILHKLTYFNNFDYVDTTPQQEYHVSDVDFLESISPIISIYMYPSNTSLPPPKYRHALDVSLRYLNIPFYTF